MAREILKDFPDQPLALYSLASVQGEAGYWIAATESCSKISRSKFLLPLVDRFVILSLWGAGELARAEAALDQASTRWPFQRIIRELRIELLMHSGRALDSLDLIEKERSSPSTFTDEELRVAAATAQGLDGSVPVAEAIGTNLDAVRAGTLTAVAAAQRVAALGDVATAFDLLEGYYLALGPFAGAPPKGGDEDRWTNVLFLPPMRALWRTDRFGALLAMIGLEGFWRDEGVGPDFRET